MTKSQRKVLRTTGLMGVLLTGIVVVLDQLYALEPLERLLYDNRARYCQLYLDKPTDKIVHFDIDDAAIASLGRWPWPRTRLARMTDELRRAGAKVVAFDILFPESEGPAQSESAQGPEPSAADRTFADALRSCGDALLPASFEFQSVEPPDPVYAAAVQELQADLELAPRELQERLINRGVRNASPEQVTGVFVRAREQAMLDRLLDPALKGQNLEILRARLLSHSQGLSTSPTIRLLRQQYELARTITCLMAKGRQEPAGLPPLLRASDMLQAPVAELGAASRYSGFVNYLPRDDGIVRTVPLWVEYRGKLIPQIGLALACAQLDVDPKDPRQVEVSGERVVLHPAHEPPIIIPVNSYRARAYGDVGMQINIPWAGRNWKTVYGADADGNPLRHYSLNVLWDACERRDAIVQNNRNADDAIKKLLNDIDANLCDAYLKLQLAPDDFDSRERWIRRSRDAADAEFMNKYRAGQLSAEEKSAYADTIKAYLALTALESHTSELRDELARISNQLRRDVGGKAVLVGSVATAAKDAVATSIGADCPGLVVHSTIFNAIMSRRLLWEAPHGIALVIAIVLGLLTTAAVTFMSPWAALATTAAMCGTYLAVNGLWLYDRHHVILAAAAPVAATAVVWSGSTLFRYILERAEKTRITRRFRSYVDPGLVDYAIENEHLVGARKEVTIVFTDLKGFTELTERVGEAAVNVLGEYMGEMVPVIRFCRGYVNKFIGDGIMCLFGALEPNPDHAGDALAAVLRMNQALDKFNDRLRARDLPPLVMRAGINTGTAVVGDAGPSAIASDFTALGDPVNLASRLEAANKVVGTHILIGSRTAELLKDRYLLRPIGRLRVLGKTELVMTYEPVALLQAATDEQKRLVQETAAVVDLFQAGRFDVCLEAIVAAERRLGSSNRLFELYRELCERYQREMPIDFRGQIVLEVK